MSLIATLHLNVKALPALPRLLQIYRQIRRSPSAIAKDRENNSNANYEIYEHECVLLVRLGSARALQIRPDPDTVQVQFRIVPIAKAMDIEESSLPWCAADALHLSAWGGFPDKTVASIQTRTALATEFR